MPDCHAVGLTRSDPAFRETAEQPPFSRCRRGFGLCYLPYIDGLYGQTGIAQTEEAEADDDILAPFERLLGRHFEVERCRSGAQFRRGKITPRQLNPARRR